MNTANTEKFHYELLIREHHLDTFEHVNNATYLQILEEARWEILAQKGHGLKTIQEKGIGPVLLEIHIKYMAELKLREKIIISTQCISVDTKIAVLWQEIKNTEGKLCCTAKLTMGVFDLQTRKLIELPQDWKNVFGI